MPFHVVEGGATPFGDVPWPSDLYLTDGHIGEVPGLARVAGLPEAIQGGLSALDGFGRSTGALFFVATGRGDGSHHFSRTLEEHNAAVQRYLRQLRQQRSAR